jgi:hypothetical protein
VKCSNAIRRAHVFFLTLGGLVVAPQLAQAQRRPRPQQAPPAEDPRVVEARRAYDDGRRLFEARSYVEALRRFERAFELRNTAVILVAIANCHEQTGNYRDAVAALERYLRERADAPDRAQIEQRLTELRPRAAQQSTASTTTATSTAAGAGTTAGASGTAGASAGASSGSGVGATSNTGGASGGDARASGATNSSTQPAGSGASASGAQQAAASGEGANGASGGAAANTAEAGGEPSASAPAEPVAPPPARGISPAVWVCAGLAAAGVAGGSVLGFLALGDHATYNTAPTRELKDRGETYALLADLSFATAVLSGFVGTVVFLSDRAEAEREQRASQALRPHERSRRASTTRVLPAPTGLTVHF